MPCWGTSFPNNTYCICLCPDDLWKKKCAWWQMFLTLSGSVLIVFNESGQAKVSDLTHQVITNQNVSGAQISVNVVHPLNVGHACSHLHTQTLTLKCAEQSQIRKE